MKVDTSRTIRRLEVCQKGEGVDRKQGWVEGVWFMTPHLFFFLKKEHDFFFKVDLQEFIFLCHIFLPFHTVHGVPDVQARFRKGRGTRDQIANIRWIIEKATESQKNIYFCFIYYAKAFDCLDHNKLWKILQELGIPDHLTCLLRNLYAGQEATVRTGHGTTDWFQIRKGVYQGCILSPCLLYAEYIMWNARLDEAQARIKIARRNIHNFRYADDTPLWQKVKRN